MNTNNNTSDVIIFDFVLGLVPEPSGQVAQAGQH